MLLTSGGCRGFGARRCSLGGFQELRTRTSTARKPVVADIAFDREAPPDYDRPRGVAPGVRRLTARNPGPFTFHVTNSYLIGDRSLAVIDPGPDDDAHIGALLAAAGGEPVTHILLTHTHLDHSAG